MKYDIKIVSTADVRIGDVLVCPDGYLRTVTPKNIKYDSFVGYSIFGNCFLNTQRTVELAINIKDERINEHRQS